ncbi:MAG TPA: ATP-binding cassette domain-containing protein [Acidisarcina sp.]|nr:ATP-binding cassette domain-containing protein [Acidisarcina sp.]
MSTETRPFLTAQLQSRLGSFSLRAEFSLWAPWTVLFAPSGAGKTSVLRLLAGLTRPDRGSVLFRGNTLVNTAQGIFLPPGLRSIGFVTQQSALFQHMSVAENVAFGLRKLPLAERQRRVEAMLSLLQAESLANRRPAQLSGGEQQRVALARALAPEPQMVLLDEPFSALDATLKERVLPRLAAWLDERNIPAFYVSHDLAEAFQTAAEVIVMHEGVVVAQGSADEVLAEERNRLLRNLHIHPKV